MEAHTERTQQYRRFEFKTAMNSDLKIEGKRDSRMELRTKTTNGHVHEVRTDVYMVTWEAEAGSILSLEK